MTESTERSYYLRSSSGLGNLSLPLAIYSSSSLSDSSSSSLSDSSSSSLSNSSENLLEKRWQQPTSQSQNGVRCCREALKLLTSKHIEEVMEDGEKIKNKLSEKMKTLSLKIREERLDSMSQLSQSQQFFSSQEGLSSQTVSRPNTCWTSRMMKRRRVFPNEEIDEDEEIIRAPTPNIILFDRVTSQQHSFERRRLNCQEL